MNEEEEEPATMWLKEKEKRNIGIGWWLLARKRLRLRGKGGTPNVLRHMGPAQTNTPAQQTNRDKGKGKVSDGISKPNTLKSGGRILSKTIGGSGTKRVIVQHSKNDTRKEIPNQIGTGNSEMLVDIYKQSSSSNTFAVLSDIERVPSHELNKEIIDIEVNPADEGHGLILLTVMLM